MIRKTSSLIEASMMFYYMSILGIMVYIYQNPSIIEDIGLVEGFKNMNTTINVFLIVMLIVASSMISYFSNSGYFLESTFLYIIYQASCYFFTKYLIQKFALDQSGENLFNFIMAPVILYMIFIACLKFVSRILFGKRMYLEIKILDKKAQSWKRFKKYGVSGFITTNIFAEISSANGYIEASCSNIILPDYYYKRFSFDEEGYEAAYNWITEKGKYMHMSRFFTVGEDGSLKSLCPQTYEWNQETLKNEPCLFGIEVDLENEQF